MQRPRKKNNEGLKYKINMQVNFKAYPNSS